MARRGRPSSSLHREIIRSIRTREHIIADLGIIHFQWIATKCGHVAEAPRHDYGYDLTLVTFTEKGEVENGFALFQFKATDHLERYILRDGKTLSFPVGRQHIDLWREEPMPVFLVIFDAHKEQAYWLDMQRYFQSSEFSPGDDQWEVSLRIPMINVVDAAAIETMRARKQNSLQDFKEAL